MMVEHPVLKLAPGRLCKWEEWRVYERIGELRVAYSARILEKPLPEHLRDVKFDVDERGAILCVADLLGSDGSGTFTSPWRTFFVSAPVQMLKELYDDLRSGAALCKEYPGESKLGVTRWRTFSTRSLRE